MCASQQHITVSTPVGANLVASGGTFRMWAPRATAVYVSGDFNGWVRDDSSLLVKNSDDRWTGFVPRAVDGHEYKFYVVGKGTDEPGARRNGPLRYSTGNPDAFHGPGVLRRQTLGG